MAQQHIFVDKSEIILRYMAGNKLASLNLTSSDVQRIVFETYKERSLFGSRVGERIIVYTSKSRTPVTYVRKAEKKFFDQYKTDLEYFAKAHHISIMNRDAAASA